MNYEYQLGGSPAPTANKATLCEGGSDDPAGISILSKNVAPPSRHRRRRLLPLLRDILDRETTP